VFKKVKPRRASVYRLKRCWKMISYASGRKETAAGKAVKKRKVLTMAGQARRITAKEEKSFKRVAQRIHLIKINVIGKAGA